jgi:cell division protein FtsB
MPRKSFAPEQIIAKLRQVEVLISQRHAVAGGLPGGWDLGTELLPLAYGGRGVTQARQLKALKRESQQLKRLVADLALDKALLEEVFRGNF